jgi:dihydrodipicolinate synthase/N-acetylneuraminate lyase
MLFHGVLFFPVAPFDPTGRLNEGIFAEHVAQGVEARAIRCVSIRTAPGR